MIYVPKTTEAQLRMALKMIERLLGWMMPLERDREEYKPGSSGHLWYSAKDFVDTIRKKHGWEEC